MHLSYAPDNMYASLYYQVLNILEHAQLCIHVCVFGHSKVENIKGGRASFIGSKQHTFMYVDYLLFLVQEM